MIVTSKLPSRPSGRSLRSHKKSRNGCQRCKDRKIKCDELRPICRTCSRRFGSLEPCVYGNENATSTPTPTPSKCISTSILSMPIQTLHPRPKYAMTHHPESNMRRWEFRLFHHFTTSMAMSMPNYGRVEVDQFWKIEVPQLAFKSDVLLSTVLGIAASHLLSHNCKDTKMKQYVHFYQAKSANQLSNLLSKTNKETAKSILLVASLLVLQTRMRAIFIPDDEPYCLPLRYFYLHRGAEFLIIKIGPLIQASNSPTFLKIKDPPYDSNPLCKAGLSEHIWQDNLLLLEGTNTAGFDTQVKHHIEGAIAYLNGIYVALLTKHEDIQWTRRRLISMPIYISISFVRLLEKHDPRAMAILARFMALMKPCGGIWYYQGCAEYEVEGIASLMPPEWLWAMEWPRQILTYDAIHFGI